MLEGTAARRHSRTARTPRRGATRRRRGDEQGYLLKPMNCPHHTQIYAHKPRSYRDLPVRLAEFGTVYRYEQSGELGGLTRVRGFTQDDAHVFCTPDQVKDEFKAAIALTLTVLRALDFQEFTAQVSLRDPANTDKYIGDAATGTPPSRPSARPPPRWASRRSRRSGEAAFYGPKLDFMVKDALGRSWQLGTVQLRLQPARALRPDVHRRERRARRGRS